MKDLAGRTAILTGASRGIGVEIARHLARARMNLVLAARSAEDLEVVRREVEALGARAVAIPTDVTDADARRALVAGAGEAMGPVDVLVNNAGIERVAAYVDYPPDEIEAVLAVNLTAPMLLTREVLPGMLERGRGHVVNVASLAGKSSFPYEAPYTASKAGLIGFTRALRAELHGGSVSASVVCPGFVEADGMYARVMEQGFPAPKVMRPTTPRAVAEAVVKAVTTDAAELVVNGGPIRPLLALAEAFPQMERPALKVLGLIDYGRRVVSARPPGRV